MAQLTVELDDHEMARVRAAVRARQIDPNHWTSNQLLQVLTTKPPRKVKTRPVWIRGAAARMMRMKGCKLLIIGHAGNRAVEVSPRRHQTVVHAEPTAAAKIAVAVANANIVPINSAAAHAQRLAAIMGMHGIWKDDPTKPQDGVEYQREVRGE
ncbi:hypothetical protein [Rugamonas sp.]|uniref:hypothetical protein n=1 Tax=Rugamonas sp. TaxID=1926287 RepID=UPI0025E7D643|nr:hypothetical protein [Rugamonas sp.]